MPLSRKTIQVNKKPKPGFPYDSKYIYIPNNAFPVPNDTILDFAKFKTFADDKCDSKIKICFRMDPQYIEGLWFWEE